MREKREDTERKAKNDRIYRMNRMFSKVIDLEAEND